jgi:hypothetical protein
MMWLLIAEMLKFAAPSTCMTSGSSDGVSEKSPITIMVLLEDALTGMKKNSVLTVENWFRLMLVGTPPPHVLVVKDVDVMDEDDGLEVTDDVRPELEALLEDPIPVEEELLLPLPEDDVLLVLVVEPLELEDE